MKLFGLIGVFVCIFSVQLMAQPGPPPPDPDEPVPITGIELLLVGGAAYGVSVLRRNRKGENSEEKV